MGDSRGQEWPAEDRRHLVFERNTECYVAHEITSKRHTVDSVSAAETTLQERLYAISQGNCRSAKGGVNAAKREGLIHGLSSRNGHFIEKSMARAEILRMGPSGSGRASQGATD